MTLNPDQRKYLESLCTRSATSPKFQPKCSRNDKTIGSNTNKIESRIGSRIGGSTSKSSKINDDTKTASHSQRSVTTDSSKKRRLLLEAAEEKA